MTNAPPPTRHWNPEDFGSCTCANLRMATRAVTQAFDEALRPSGHKATQLTLLAVLSKRGPAALSELAEILVMDRTTLTRNLKPLAAKHLVRIDPGDDRRLKIIALTDRGRGTLEAALPRWREVQARIVGGLGEGPWRELLGRLAQTTALTRT